MSAVPRVATARSQTPHRQFNRAAKPALHLGDFGSLDALAAELQRRVREMLYARGAGTLVACDPDGGVYLLMELEMRTERFYAERFEWVVGVYASAPANGPATVPSRELLLEDLQHHLATRGALAPLNARAVGA